MMNTTPLAKLIFVFVVAGLTYSKVHSQSDDSPPVFRPRTDANAARDLQHLRNELNKASDSKGAVNSLGNFLQRNAEPAVTARLEIGPNAPDKESQQKPTLDPTSTQRKLAPAASLAKSTKGIVMLPGPRITIIQQASPQLSSSVVDGFRPVRFASDLEASVRPALPGPVAFASANIPILTRPDGYIANYQAAPEYPTVGTIPGFMDPSILPNQPGIPAILPSYTQPNLPMSQPPTSYGPPTIISNPLPNTSPLSPTGIPGAAYTQPTPYPPQNYNPNPQNYNPNPPMSPGFSGGVPMRSPTDSVMPVYPRSAPVVNGAPFVSSPPCQFDARYMVSRDVYRQSVDPCAQPLRGGNAYAPSPYAPQSGGSPFAYAPPTGMAYNNNGYNSGYRSLIGFGQSLNNAYLGRGIIGQPTAYVDGQPFRNFLRYIFP